MYGPKITSKALHMEVVAFKPKQKSRVNTQHRLPLLSDHWRAADTEWPPSIASLSEDRSFILELWKKMWEPKYCQQGQKHSRGDTGSEIVGSFDS